MRLESIVVVSADPADLTYDGMRDSFLGVDFTFSYWCHWLKVLHADHCCKRCADPTLLSESHREWNDTFV